MEKKKIDNHKLPRIVLKDRNGNKLNTESKYQNKIAYERLRLKEYIPHGDDSFYKDFDWRLPTAPVPSKPDYSRFRCNFNTKIRNFNQNQWAQEYFSILKHRKFVKYLDLSSFHLKVCLTYLKILSPTYLFPFYLANGINE
jgi:hypothetical protein